MLAGGTEMFLFCTFRDSASVTGASVVLFSLVSSFVSHLQVVNSKICTKNDLLVCIFPTNGGRMIYSLTARDCGSDETTVNDGSAPEALSFRKCLDHSVIVAG
jgi:hypothetical protein